MDKVGIGVGKMILARYSRLKATAFCMGAATFAFYVVSLPFIIPGGAHAYFTSGNLWANFYPIVAVLAAISLFFIVRLTLGVISKEATAISLDGNLLQLISGRVIQISKQDVDKVGLQRAGAFPFRFTYLCFYLKNAEVKKVPTSLFDESAEKVCNSVRVALSLPN